VLASSRIGVKQSAREGLARCGSRLAPCAHCRTRYPAPGNAACIRASENPPTVTGWLVRADRAEPAGPGPRMRRHCVRRCCLQSPAAAFNRRGTDSAGQTPNRHGFSPTRMCVEHVQPTAQQRRST
jgi:hypothetical protein